MSKLNRFDVYIGILDDTNDLIKRAENQYKFEKYLTDFLNTNIYSKDKKWVFGTDCQISQHCKHKIDTIFGLQNKIIDLKSQLAEKDKEQNQKALEQLEKVKGILIQNADEIGEEYKEDYFMISLGNVKNIIDQQINKLKGKVEDER